MPEDEVNSRISKREFYIALLKQNERMDDMERRILGRIDEISKTPVMVAHNAASIAELRDDIDNLKSVSTWWSGANTALAIIGGIIGSIFGTKQ